MLGKIILIIWRDRKTKVVLNYLHSLIAAGSLAPKQFATATLALQSSRPRSQGLPNSSAIPSQRAAFPTRVTIDAILTYPGLAVAAKGSYCGGIIPVRVIRKHLAIAYGECSCQRVPPGRPARDEGRRARSRGGARQRTVIAANTIGSPRFTCRLKQVFAQLC
jgi:hypothetical protein